MNSEQFLKRLLYRIRGRVVCLSPRTAPKGNVLLSYSTVAFFKQKDDPLSAHANYWVTAELARIFLARGYAVDVIEWDNTSFKPQKPYHYVVDTHGNLERLAPLLGPDCIKIFHASAAHWLFQNTAEYQRHLALQQRRGVTLFPQRLVSPARNIEYADVVSMYGNEFTVGTYTYAGAHIELSPFPSTHLFPFPEQKRFGEARNHFVWFAGSGAVHKGLDLVIEAFADLPEYTLSICGKVESDAMFTRTYDKELALPNIRILGHVDPGGSVFAELAQTAIANVFPSCSEGAGGSAIVTTHAGIIPIVTRESGNDVRDFGILLQEASVHAIKEAVHALASESPEQLRTRSRKGWEYVRAHHTREIFSNYFEQLIERLERDRV